MPHLRAASETRTRRALNPSGHTYKVSCCAQACTTVSDHLRPTDPISIPDLAPFNNNVSAIATDPPTTDLALRRPVQHLATPHTPKTLHLLDTFPTSRGQAQFRVSPHALNTNAQIAFLLRVKCVFDGICFVSLFNEFMYTLGLHVRKNCPALLAFVGLVECKMLFLKVDDECKRLSMGQLGLTRKKSNQGEACDLSWSARQLSKRGTGCEELPMSKNGMAQVDGDNQTREKELNCGNERDARKVRNACREDPNSRKEMDAGKGKNVCKERGKHLLISKPLNDGHLCVHMTIYGARTNHQ
ncbi:hypothetical protein EDB83DRAFT_2320287 [Lactarius deliciosus]|nr:hypothetical protein EDB83DRAFT_2320287 [Lactarius deliciosus]